MAANLSSPWTAELKQEVFDLWKQMSASQIVGVLNSRGYTFSRNAIVGVLHRGGQTIDNKSHVHPLTRENGTRRPRVPRHEQNGAPVGSLAFKVINGIRRRQKFAADPSIDPSPFVCRDAADIEPRNLTLMELESGECRYTSGDSDFRFCGHPIFKFTFAGVDKQSSYCESHHRLTHQDMPAPKRAPYVDIGKHHGGSFGRVA